MGPIRYRTLSIVCLILFVVSFTVGYYVRDYIGVGVVVVRNEGEINIHNGYVKICGNTFLFSNLSAGMDVVFPYEIKCESGIYLYAEMESGDLLETKNGYVSPGLSGVVSVFSIEGKSVKYAQRGQ